MTLLLVVWIACAFANATLWEQKGRAPLAGFLLGLAFGVLAVAYSLALLPPTRDALVQDGTHKLCPHCAELVRREATRCRYCHAALPPASAD